MLSIFLLVLGVCLALGLAAGLIFGLSALVVTVMWKAILVVMVIWAVARIIKYFTSRA